MKRKMVFLYVILCFFCTACEFSDKEEVREISDTLNICVVKADSFCPYTEESISAKQMLSLIYEPLFSYNEDFVATPVLAESFFQGSDGKSVTVNLKKDVLWHNGTEFLADDVLYTVAVMLQNGENSDKIVSAEKVDDYCVKINFTRPFLNLPEKLTFPIINKAPKVGTGAYRFSEKISADTYMLEKFKGQGTINKIKVISCPDEEAVKRLFEIGEADLMLPYSVNYENFNKSSSVKVYNYPVNKLIYLDLSLLPSENTRQALMYILNKTDISEKIFHSRAVLADFPVNPKSVLYPEEKGYKRNIKTAEELLKRDGFTRYGGAFGSLNVKLFAEDNGKNRFISEKIKNALENFGIGCEVIIKENDESINADLVLEEKELNSASDFLNLTETEEFSHIVSEDNTEVLGVYYKRFADEFLKKSNILPICFYEEALVTSLNIEGRILPVINNPFYTIDEWSIRR